MNTSSTFWFVFLVHLVHLYSGICWVEFRYCKLNEHIFHFLITLLFKTWGVPFTFQTFAQKSWMKSKFILTACHSYFPWARTRKRKMSTIVSSFLEYFSKRVICFLQYISKRVIYFIKHILKQVTWNIQYRWYTCWSQGCCLNPGNDKDIIWGVKQDFNTDNSRKT